VVEVAQSLQSFDLLFAFLGWTKTSLVAGFFQISSRLFIVFTAVQICPDHSMWLFLTFLAWATIEVIRYPFYFFKSFDGDEPSILSRILGHLRYNAFLIVYPLGATGEMFLSFDGLGYVDLSYVKPFTIEMPNEWNLAFNYKYFVSLLPLLYFFGFNFNFSYMMAQRRKFYESTAKEKLE